MKSKFGKRRLLLWPLGVFFLLITAKTGLGNLRDQIERLPQIVAEVNNEPLMRESLLDGMLKQRYAIARYFYQKHAVVSGPEFWDLDTRYADEGPFFLLFRLSLKLTIKKMILHQLAVINGLVDFSFENIDSLRAAHNLERNEAISKGDLIYGPKYFATLSFEDHYLALLKIELEARFLQGYLILPHWSRGSVSEPLPDQFDAILFDLREDAIINYYFSF